MMDDAGFEAAGAECTADIHIETGAKVKPAEVSDFCALMRRAPHDQGICTGLCFHLLYANRPEINIKLFAESGRFSIEALHE